MGRKLIPRDRRPFRIRESDGSSHVRIVLFLSAFIFAVIATLLLGLSNSRREKEERVDSYILAHADLIKKLIELENSSELLVNHPLLSDLYERKIRPAQDKFRSLQRQTEIYEEMYNKNPVAGGLKNFAESSLKQLDSVLGEVDGSIDGEVQAAINEYNKVSDEIKKKVEEAFALNERVMEAGADPGFIEWFTKENIFFRPPKGKKLDALLKATPIEKVEQALRKLGELYKEFHPAMDKVRELKKQDPESFKTPVREALENPQKYPEVAKAWILDAQIKMEIQDNKNIYQLTNPIIDEKSAVVANYQTELNKQFVRRSLSYFDVKRLLKNGIANLRKRIEQLAAN